MTFPNMPAGEWPDLTAEELIQVGDVLDDVAYMHANFDEVQQEG